MTPVCLIWRRNENTVVKRHNTGYGNATSARLGNRSLTLSRDGQASE
jgi:hypothetical protein